MVVHMSKELVEQLAQAVYGEGVSVQTGEVAEGIVQAAVLHPAGIPFVLVTARTSEVALAATAAALEVVRGTK